MKAILIIVMCATILLSMEKGCLTRDLYRRHGMPWVWTCPGCPPPYFPDDLPQIRGSRQASIRYLRKRAFEPWFLYPSQSQYPYDTPFFPEDEKGIFDRSIMQV